MFCVLFCREIVNNGFIINFIGRSLFGMKRLNIDGCYVWSLFELEYLEFYREGDTFFLFWVIYLRRRDGSERLSRLKGVCVIFGSGFWGLLVG